MTEINPNHIFVDTNVLIGYLCGKYGILKDREGNTDALRYLFRQNGKRLYTSALAIAQLTAKLQRKLGTEKLTEEIKALMHKFIVLDFSAKDIEDALNEDNYLCDVEDTYQFCMARKAKCCYLMTNNLKDFRDKYNIEVFRPARVRRFVYD